MISSNVEKTRKIAIDLAHNLKPAEKGATLVALSGELGSGKTTFAKALAEYFGISGNEITSPTFVIMKSYDIAKDISEFAKLVHIDAYRLEKAEEIEKLGWRKILSDPRSLILLEWPENIGKAMPESAKKIGFRFIDENTREIVFN